VTRHECAGRKRGGHKVFHQVGTERGFDPAPIAPECLVLARLIANLVAGHGDEQLEQLFRRTQLKPGGPGPDEEVGKNALRDVCRFQHSVQPKSEQHCANGPMDLRLVAADDFGLRLLIAGTDLLDQFAKRARAKHIHHNVKNDRPGEG
jgi:hypothetical protein